MSDSRFDEIFGEYLPRCDFWNFIFPSRAKNRRISYKLQVIEAYGGACSCCGEKQWEFLTIDHINGGGRLHRKQIRTNIYRWLILQGFPKEGFRLLCLNCHMATSFYGYCPHKTEAPARRMLEAKA